MGELIPIATPWLEAGVAVVPVLELAQHYSKGCNRKHLLANWVHPISGRSAALILLRSLKLLDGCCRRLGVIAVRVCSPAGKPAGSVDPPFQEIVLAAPQPWGASCAN